MKSKKFTSIIVVFALALTLVCPISGYAEGIKVTLNGEQIQFDQPPVVINDRTLVPVRAIFEAMGCTVLWDGTNQIVNVATEFGMMAKEFLPYIRETFNRKREKQEK